MGLGDVSSIIFCIFYMFSHVTIIQIIFKINELTVVRKFDVNITRSHSRDGAGADTGFPEGGG